LAVNKFRSDAAVSARWDAATRPTGGVGSLYAAHATSGPSKAFGVASVATFAFASEVTFAVDDTATRGRMGIACAGAGESPGKLVAAVASKPVAKAVVIFVAACAIAFVLPE
jgi:hypothetical protein